MLASTGNADRQPFRLTPDPEFVYICPAQLDAYSKLFSAIHQQQHWLLLTGEPGTGKSLFLRRLQLDLANSGIAVRAFWNPLSSPMQLWEACCERLGLHVDPDQDVGALSAMLSDFGDNATSIVLLLDEADTIPTPVLESMASVVAECSGAKAEISVLFCGRPALQQRLEVLGIIPPIETHVSLDPLHTHEVAHFIRHQLRAQTGELEHQFSNAAVERIIVHCAGFPAQINALCSSALLQAEVEERVTITAEMIDALAAREWMKDDYLDTNNPSAPDAETNSAMEDDELRNIFDVLESTDTGHLEPFSGVFAAQQEPVDSIEIIHGFDDPSSVAHSDGPILGDLQKIDPGALPAQQTDEEATLRASDPDPGQLPKTPERTAPQQRPLQRRALSRGLAGLAMLLLLALPASNISIPHDRTTQAMTWIENASHDLLLWLDQTLQSWSPSSATLTAEPPPQESRLPSTDDTVTASTPTQENTAGAEPVMEPDPPAPANSLDGVKAVDRSARAQSPVLPEQDPTSAPRESAPRAEEQRIRSASATTRVTDPMVAPPIEKPDAIPGRIIDAGDATPIAEVESAITTSTEGSKLQTRLHSVAQITGREDGAILLAIESANLRTSEHEVQIRGLPKGASFSVGRLRNGVWIVSVEELSNIALTPAKNSDNEISLTLRLVRTRDRKEIQMVPVTVFVNAVADPPRLFVNAADGDQFTAIPIEIRTALSDNDGSERLSITVGGLPNSVKLSAGRRVNNKWVLASTDLAGLFMTPMAGAPSELALIVEAVATESANGHSAVTRRVLEIDVVLAKS